MQRLCIFSWINLQFAGVEALSTAVIDHWPHLQSKKSTVTAWVCVACCIPGIPMCWGGGVYFFTLLEWHVMTWSIMLCGFLEIAFVAWVYGKLRFLFFLLKKHITVKKMFSMHCCKKKCNLHKDNCAVKARNML